MEGGRQQPLLKRYTYILGVVAAYWTVSITLVFVNKSLLSGAQKLDAPLFITCYQCVITVAACYVLRYVSQMKLTLTQPKHCWYLAVQAFTLHRWAATKLPNLVSFPELTVDPSILKQVTRNEMSRSFIQTLTGASSLRNLRRDDHIQQPLPPPRWRILLLHRTESDHRLQRFAHIFHSRPENESCSCVLLCRHPRWLLSWG